MDWAIIVAAATAGSAVIGALVAWRKMGLEREAGTAQQVATIFDGYSQMVKDQNQRIRDLEEDLAQERDECKTEIAALRHRIELMERRIRNGA